MPDWRRIFRAAAPEPAEPPRLPAREPRIRSRGAPMPFSKGRMAQALVLAGAEPERAYQLALADRSARCSRIAEDEIPIDAAARRSSRRCWPRRRAPQIVSRYHGWHEVLRLDRPLMLLLGGATGTGKSTLASEIAYRLGISRITSTDAIRQVMRAFFAAGAHARAALLVVRGGRRASRCPMPDPDSEDRALYGFLQQAGQVAVGANAVVERAVLEGLSTVVEGVHLVPGLVAADQHAGAVVVQVMLDDHRRGDPPGATSSSATWRAAGGGSMDRYLRSFGEIRRIQDYLVARAEKEGWPVVEAGDPDQALIAVMDLILERATARAAAVP